MYEDILKDLESNLSFTYGNNITQYDSGYICDVFSEIADSNVDIYTSDLFDWGKNNIYYIDDSIIFEICQEKRARNDSKTKINFNIVKNAKLIQ